MVFPFISLYQLVFLLCCRLKSNFSVNYADSTEFWIVSFGPCPHVLHQLVSKLTLG